MKADAAWKKHGEPIRRLSLAEFESRCRGTSPGTITPDDVVRAINLVSDLGEEYRERIFTKAAQWRRAPRMRKRGKKAAVKCGIENSLPKGDI